MSKPVEPGKDLDRILKSAKRLGVELDEEEALQWLAAMAADEPREGFVRDERTGVFGHRVSMIDFSQEDLEHFRELGRLVEFPDEPGRVETALALSGSAAQSKVQTYPGDADYFERVNILAPTREEACAILAEIMHNKVIESFKGPTYQLIEVKLGSLPEDIVVEGELRHKDSPISWNAQQAKDKKIEGFSPDGKAITILWDEAAKDPGWCKLDWVVADPIRGTLANASNMLDVTWEAPDGSITPLDGYLDPYFQEVYLEAESVPIFSKLAQHVSANALDDYVGQLEGEVNKYLTKTVNYGKAAKRMYNIFRLTGKYGEATFIRELFDEPASMLYQVYSLIRTIEDCSNPNSPITSEQMLAQADQLTLSVISALEGDQETEIVRHLLKMRDALSNQKTNQELSIQATAARDALINIVNNFFYEKLTAVPEIKSYMDGFIH
ncbi:MAG TPA: hypothetical protein VJZ78_01810 [Anaerolineales bacterium]|nr:hypothetical protein [Anaerolineales bacterium]